MATTGAMAGRPRLASRTVGSLLAFHSPGLGILAGGVRAEGVTDAHCVPEKTVKNYVSRLLAKLGMERRTQAAVLATELRDQTHRRYAE